MRVPTNDEMIALEALIDSCGLPHVVEAIAEVCEEKVLHIETNWQDFTTSQVWKINARHLNNVLQKLEL